MNVLKNVFVESNSLSFSIASVTLDSGGTYTCRGLNTRTSLTEEVTRNLTVYGSYSVIL